MSRKALQDLLVQRIALLEDLAVANARRDFSLATSYARMALKLKQRHRLRVGRLVMCKRCDSPLIPGISARFRKRMYLTTTCLTCGHVIRKTLHK